LAEKNFEVAISKNDDAVHACFVQATKKGPLRTASGTRRSIDITIKGTPDSFEISLGSGEWGNNLIVSAPLFIIPVIGITTTAAKLYTAKKLESNLWKKIKESVEVMRDSAANDKNSTIESPTHSEYKCDYVRGYPGWEDKVLGGKMMLERKSQETDQLIFKAPDGEQITIPASKIEKASIILREKGTHDDDLMLEITCRDKNGDIVNPTLSLSDSVATNALLGINNLVENNAQKLSKTS
jgi:hypothetical protein